MEEQMKKTLALLLVMVMVFGLCACGSQPAAAPAASQAPAADAPAAAPADGYHLELKLSHVFGPTEQLAVFVQEAAVSYTHLRAHET